MAERGQLIDSLRSESHDKIKNGSSDSAKLNGISKGKNGQKSTFVPQITPFSRSGKGRLMQTLLGDNIKYLANSHQTESSEAVFDSNLDSASSFSAKSNHQIADYGSSNEEDDQSLRYSPADMMQVELENDDNDDGKEEDGDEAVTIEPMDLVTNFIRLIRSPTHDVHLFTFRCEPSLSDAKLTRKLFDSWHVQRRLRGKPFLYKAKFFLPHQIDDFEMFPIPHPDLAGCNFRLTIKYVRAIPVRRQIFFFNCLFKEMMKRLNRSFMKNKFFDEFDKINLEEWLMEIWPGYVLNVVQMNQSELMLLCDISHRVLHRKNVYAHLQLLQPNDRFRELASRHLIGQTVFTKYNARTYRIDDIDFQASPLTTFKWGSIEISYVKYFCDNFKIKIKHLDQPLLVHRKYMSKTNSYRLIHLIPELCDLTGSRVAQHGSQMLKLVSHSQPSANLRYHKLMKYIEIVRRNPETSELLEQWGLTIDRASYTEIADKPPEEMIISAYDCDNVRHGANRNTASDMNLRQRNSACSMRRSPQSNNWSQILRYSLLNPISITDNWLVIFPRFDGRLAEAFVRGVRKYARTMSIELALPRMIELLSCNAHDYIAAIKNGFESDDKIIVVVTPGTMQIKQRYDAIKRYCTIKLGIPTQFIRAGTLVQPRRFDSICPNLLLQMTCKIGGSPWGIQMPLARVMYVGIDIYHRDGRGKSEQNAKFVIGFVASLDSNATRWFSKAYIVKNDRHEDDAEEEDQNLMQDDQHDHNICDDSLIEAMTEALYKYRAYNGYLPRYIIVYRAESPNVSAARLCQIEYAMIRDAVREVYELDCAIISGHNHDDNHLHASPSSKKMPYEDDGNAKSSSITPSIVFMTIATKFSLGKLTDLIEDTADDNGGNDDDDDDDDDDDEDDEKVIRQAMNDMIENVSNGIDLDESSESHLSNSVQNVAANPLIDLVAPSLTEAGDENTIGNRNGAVENDEQNNVYQERFDEFYLAPQMMEKTCACPIRIRVLRNTTCDADHQDNHDNDRNADDDNDNDNDNEDNLDDDRDGGAENRNHHRLTTASLQSLSYKLCYLYYNSASICRQPAPGMYAHKIANFVGEHLDQSAAEDLEDKLFYL